MRKNRRNLAKRILRYKRFKKFDAFENIYKDELLVKFELNIMNPSQNRKDIIIKMKLICQKSKYSFRSERYAESLNVIR